MIYMARKGENIYKRKDGRWEGRYRKARNEHGQLVYGYVYGRKYTEVKQKLERLKIDYAFSLQPQTVFNGTLNEWMTYWLNQLIANQIKQSTYASYQQKITQHILPLLGSRPLTALNEQDLEKLLVQLGEKGLSNATIHTIFTIINAALSKAIKERIIKENPCILVDLPKIRRPEILVLTRAQQRQLEQAALKEKNCSPVIIALYTGMRIGEISGLKWGDVDLDNRTIQVQRTIQRISTPNGPTKTTVIAGTPKTKSSLRTIPIADNLVKYLASKKKYTNSPFVIGTARGYMEPRLISLHFKRLATLLGLENIHFHALRHTFATRCIEQGIDVATVSKLLGHKSTKMTLDTYTGSLWETREQAMALIDHQLSLMEEV